MRTALVVMAHPDDAEVMLGGTIASLVEQGWEVYLLVCTDGEAGGPDNPLSVSKDSRKHLVEIRRIEQQVAAQILGITGVIYLHYADGLLAPTMRLRKDIAKVIRVYKPDCVFCPSPEYNWKAPFVFNHPDHVACGEATLAAFYPSSSNAWDFPDLYEEGWKPHRVEELYITHPPIPNWYVSFEEDLLERKNNAIMAHMSQFKQNQQEIDAITSWNKRAGSKHNKEYAEEFYRIEHP